MLSATPLYLPYMVRKNIAYDKYSKDFLNDSGLTFVYSNLKNLMSLKMMGMFTFAKSPLNHPKGDFSSPTSSWQSSEGFSSIGRVDPKKNNTFACFSFFKL